MLVDAANSVVPGSSTDLLAVTMLKMDHRRLRQAVVSAQESPVATSWFVRPSNEAIYWLVVSQYTVLTMITF